MPGGFSDGSAGLAVFAAIKFVGYSAFSIYLNHLYPDRKKNILLVGAVRTMIGFAFGSLLALFSFPFVFLAGIGLAIYILGLIPVRMLEWYLLIDIFYTKELKEKIERRQAITSGVICSFLLDVPAVAGFFATGGFWIC